MAGQLEEVLRALLGAAEPVGVEWVPAPEAAGRVSAEEVRSHRCAPGFARAAMDGYVCHDEDVRNASPDRPVYLCLTGECRPGKPPAAGPRRGEAWVTSTGAAMPLQGDRVLPVELVRREGSGVVLAQPPPAKRHVVRPDEELAEGHQVACAGEVFTPGAVAALVAGGVREVRVYRRPRVVLFCTGDELTEPPGPPGPGRVLNTNAYVLTAELSQAGCVVEYGGILPDRPEAVRAAFSRALAGPYDVVLTTGGVSVGRHDRVPWAWLELGARKVAGRVDLKPGGPFFAGQLAGRWAVALSGSPAACLAAYHLLARPLLLRLGGHRRVVRPVVLATLRGALAATDRPRAVWAKLQPAPHGLEASPLGGRVLESLGGAEGLLLLPARTPYLRPGSRVPCLLLHHREVSDEFGVPRPEPAPVVVGVVGASGAGKTSVVEGLVRRLKEQGLVVAVVKHAPHGFQLDREGSDSDRAAKAGASSVVLAGDREVALRSLSRSLSLEGAVELAARGTPGAHVVLVEGFRHPAGRTILVGPPKEAHVEPPWCVLPAWSDLPEASRERLLDDLAGRLNHLVTEGE